jgi:hypothetical protein
MRNLVTSTVFESDLVLAIPGPPAEQRSVLFSGGPRCYRGFSSLLELNGKVHY